MDEELRCEFLNINDGVRAVEDNVANRGTADNSPPSDDCLDCRWSESLMGAFCWLDEIFDVGE